MIPQSLREQLADDLQRLANELRLCKTENEEMDCSCWLSSLDRQYDRLIGEHTIEPYQRLAEQQRIEAKKIVDLAAYRS